MSTFKIDPHRFVQGLRWDPVTSAVGYVTITNKERTAQKVTRPGGGAICRVRYPKITGSWYMELYVNDHSVVGSVSFGVVGVETDNFMSNISTGGNTFLYRNNSQAFIGGNYLGTAGGWDAGDTLSLAFNADTGATVLSKNGSPQFSGNLSITGNPFVAVLWFEGDTEHNHTIVDEPNLKYGIPSGYKFWDTSTSSGLGNPFAWSTTDLAVVKVASGVYYTASSGGSSSGGVRATRSFNTTNQKWYAEFNVGGGSNTNTSTPFVGMTASSVVLSNAGGVSGDSWGVLANGVSYNAGVSTAYGTPIVGSMVLMFAYDPTTGHWWAGSNGTWFNSGNPATGANPGGTTSTTENLYFTYMMQSGSSGSIVFREKPAYNIPSGFTTYNLA